MFKVGDKVVVIKGPMKGNEGSIKGIFKERDVYAVRFDDYANPGTKTGCYYLKDYELDEVSKRHCCGFSILNDYSNIRTDRCIPFFVNRLYIPMLEIKKVLFKEPATIVFWTDNTKTIVKCQDGEPYDAEKGLAMAISKKFLGNKRDYYHTFLKWLKKYNKEYKLSDNDIDELLSDMIDEVQKVQKEGNKK